MPVAEAPATVADKRAAIIDAATSCRLEGLASLAGPTFTASFGGADSSNRQADEDRGGGPMADLVTLLQMPFGTLDDDGVTIYVWPSAHAYDDWSTVPAADREMLNELYSAEELARFETFGGYAGYRVGIDENGTWLYFASGDRPS